jgi:hypothetical protein
MRNLRAALLATFLCVAFSQLQAQSAQTASLDLLKRAADPNPTLQSYTASAQLSATLHVVIPDHKTFTGTAYYLKPRRKIEFQNVTGALSRFKDLAATTPTYDEAVAEYTITPMTDDGSISSYSLVPKKQGSRVKSLTVTVNDSTALVTHAEWLYTNGGKLDFTPTYTSVGTYRLPAKTDVSARFPGYSVDGTLTFSNYKPNASVSPSIFASL